MTTPPSPGWTRDDVVKYLATVGIEITPDTWSAYVTREQAPPPSSHVGRTPVWNPDDVRAWPATRPGQGWRAGRTQHPERTDAKGPTDDPQH